jgi:hypothetical protein
MIVLAAAPCVCVMPQTAPWIGPVMGALVGAGIAALVALRTKAMDYGRHDRSVRTQLIALLKLAALQLASAAKTSSNEAPADALGAMNRLIDRTFSSDVAVALKVDEAQVVYDGVRDAETAARLVQTGLADLKKARDGLLQGLPEGPSGATLRERRMAAISDREKEIQGAVAIGVAALRSARRALGNTDLLAGADPMVALPPP